MHVNTYFAVDEHSLIMYIPMYFISVFRKTDRTTTTNRCHRTGGGCQGDTFPGLWPVIFNHRGTTFCRWRAPRESACVNRLWCESVRCTQKCSIFTNTCWIKIWLLSKFVFTTLYTGKLFLKHFEMFVYIL